MTALKSLFFFLLVPGLLLGVFPYWIAQSDVPLFEAGFFRYLAIPFWIIGMMMMVWCFWDFTVKGRGTPAPFDPPKELVATGPYRYVRNPMYVSGLISLIGWILWSPSLPLILAPVVFGVAAHTFVLLYEEPTLKKKFGAGYEAYLKQVPRWVPKFRS
ncbi:MAG TPA: isoprenylcysteine carboxylmethyltransferase family protein [Anaerolineales bacterium]